MATHRACLGRVRTPQGASYQHCDLGKAQGSLYKVVHDSNHVHDSGGMHERHANSGSRSYPAMAGRLSQFDPLLVQGRLVVNPVIKSV